MEVGDVFRVKKGGRYFGNIYLVVDKKSFMLYCVKLSQSLMPDRRSKFRLGMMSDIPHHKQFEVKEFSFEDQYEILAKMDRELIPEIANRKKEARWILRYGLNQKDAEKYPNLRV